jgi:gluconolactonase
MRSVLSLAGDLGHPQGPAVTQDGAVAFAETYRGRLAKVYPDGRVVTVLDTGGGPNAVLAADDGSLYFTQNGGQAGEWRSARQRRPSLQCLMPGAAEATLVAHEAGDRPMLAPHDLAWGPDGMLYMTDSGVWDPERMSEPGALIRVSRAGTATVLRDVGRVYPSGIAVAENGDVYWAECYTRRIMRMTVGHEPHVVCELPEDDIPECVKIGPDGSLWVAGLLSGGVLVFDAAGRQADFIKTGGMPLNCVLAGSRLYVADLGSYDEETAADEPAMTGRIVEVTL